MDDGSRLVVHSIWDWKVRLEAVEMEEVEEVVEVKHALPFVLRLCF